MEEEFLNRSITIKQYHHEVVKLKFVIHAIYYKITILLKMHLKSFKN